MGFSNDVFTRQNGPVKKIISRYLDTVGNGTGTKNAVGAYSTGAAGLFRIAPDEREVFIIERMIVSYEDAGGMQAQEYGNLGAALTNGIEVQTHNGSVVTNDLTDGVPVKTNAQWGRICYDVEVKGWGSGNDLAVVRWTFAKSGSDIRLVGDDSDELRVSIVDSTSGLITHYFLVQGWVEKSK